MRVCLPLQLLRGVEGYPVDVLPKLTSMLGFEDPHLDKRAITLRYQELRLQGGRHHIPLGTV